MLTTKDDTNVVWFTAYWSLANRYARRTCLKVLLMLLKSERQEAASFTFYFIIVQTVVKNCGLSPRKCMYFINDVNVVQTVLKY